MQTTSYFISHKLKSLGVKQNLGKFDFAFYERLKSDGTPHEQYYGVLNHVEKFEDDNYHSYNFITTVKDSPASFRFDSDEDNKVLTKSFTLSQLLEILPKKIKHFDIHLEGNRIEYRATVFGIAQYLEVDIDETDFLIQNVGLLLIELLDKNIISLN